MIAVIAILSLALAITSAQSRQGYTSYGHTDHAVDNYAHPYYQLNYGIADYRNGVKKQHNEGDGDVFKGCYCFHDADGNVRTVDIPQMITMETPPSSTGGVMQLTPSSI